jgi:Cu/Ag efflux pump CusA
MLPKFELAPMRMYFKMFTKTFRPVFFSLLVIAVAFVPIFTLVDQEGRLFKRAAESYVRLAELLAATTTRGESQGAGLL